MADCRSKKPTRNQHLPKERITMAGVNVVNKLRVRNLQGVEFGMVVRTEIFRSFRVVRYSQMKVLFKEVFIYLKNIKKSGVGGDAIDLESEDIPPKEPLDYICRCLILAKENNRSKSRGIK